MSWLSRLRARIWVRWLKMTGAYQATIAMREMAWIDRRDLCQNLNQLEENVTELRRATKARNKNLEAAVTAARDRFGELLEDRMRTQRENLMDARQEVRKAQDELDALNEEIDLMQKRLLTLENPPVEKIGG